MSDMAGKAARVAVEPNGSERDTMELMGSATWKVKLRGEQRVSWETSEFQLELGGASVGYSDR
jgi:hypothetical protein